jgi:predicted O-methyltransferase YrrM
MDQARRSLLKELEDFGTENDRRATDRREKMLNVAPEAAALLALLVRAVKARRVLEVGTSNGYSTIWLADAAEETDGRVTTVEALPAKAALAQENFGRAGLSSYIHLHLGDAGAFLRDQPPDAFDFVFLDSDRAQYIAWWPDVQKVLASGGTLVIDNAVSHASELDGFFQLVRATVGYSSVLVPVGKGELLVLKQAASRQAGPVTALLH